MISQSDNLFLQSYYSVSLLVELRNNNFLESQFFEGMSFGAPWIKEGIKTIGVDNQGSLLMSLYAMLVIPRELGFDKYQKEFNEIQDFLRANCKVIKNDYQTHKDKINYLRHMRNSVSHASVEFDPNNTITFTDTNPRSNEIIQFEFPLILIGVLLSKFQEVHLQHIRANQGNSNVSNSA